MSAQAINREQSQGEPDPLPQIRNSKYVGKLLPHLLNDLCLTTGLSDLLLGRLGKFMGFYGERRFQFAVPEYFDSVVRSLNKTGLVQQLGSDRALSQLNQSLEVYDHEFFAENIGEAALRQAAMQGHLTAFKAAHHPRSTARTLPFMAACGGLAHA